jgi:RNA recognition motif-containing protein
MAQKLFVGGLSCTTTSDGLREFFSQCGEVACAFLPMRVKKEAESHVI